MFAADNISTRIPFNANVDDAQALAEGDEAADRIISGATVIDHLKVARALMVGSRLAAAEAGMDRGKPYNVAFHKWLEQHPKLAAVNKPNRAAALWCLAPENWPRVENYLATLDVGERQTILLRTVRRRLDLPQAAPKKARPVSSAPKTEPAAPQDRVRAAADRAENATLKAELWKAKDKLDQLAMFLVDQPPPKAEDRPLQARAWPLGRQRRPKDAQIVNPGPELTKDPAFALRLEEFEQWLVRRKEALERRCAAREAELMKNFQAKVGAQVEARLAKMDNRSRILTDAQFMKLATCFHTDRRKRMSERDWDRAFSAFMNLRNRLVKASGKNKREPPAAPDHAPDPRPQDGGATARVLAK